MLSIMACTSSTDRELDTPADTKALLNLVVKLEYQVVNTDGNARGNVKEPHSSP
jgi:hypothetical protein